MVSNFESETCTFAHRMQRKDDHGPISQVFQSARKPSTGMDLKSLPVEVPTPKSSTELESVGDFTLSLPNHSYAHHQSYNAPSPRRYAARRRTASLASTDARLKAAARKAKVRASTIWSMDVKQYGGADGGAVDENETERWKRNLISLRAELAAAESERGL